MQEEQILADWILTAELGQAGAEGLPEAAERASQKLGQLLTNLVTEVGSQALFARALQAARVEHPFLAGVQTGTAPGVGLEGICASLRGAAPDVARQGIEVLFANLIGLLLVFLGEDLTRHLLGRMWDALPAELGPDQQEA